MDLPLVSRLRALVHCLGAPSISIGRTDETVILTCLSTHLPALNRSRPCFPVYYPAAIDLKYHHLTEMPSP